MGTIGSQRGELEQFDRLVEVVQDYAIFMLDPEGLVTSWNLGAERIKGYRAEEVIGHHFSRFYTPEEIARGWPREELRRAEEGGRFEDEGWRVCKDGSRFWANVVITVIRDEAGRVLGFWKITRDLTERKLAEEELRRANADLERRIGERTAELTLANAVLLEEVAERRRGEASILEQRTLAEFGLEIGLVLTESATLGEMLDRIARVTVLRLDGAFARIWTANEAGDMLELRASAGLYTHIDGAHFRVPVGRFKIGKIALERRPHMTNEVIGDPLIPDQAWAAREGLIAFAGYPLVVEDRLVGVWAMFARHDLTSDALNSMDSVARAIALGIERKRAAKALAESEAWLLTTLSSIGDAVIATDDVGLVRFMNPIAEALTGWPRDEAAGRTIQEVLDIINEQTRRPAEHPVARVIREGIIVGLANHTILISRGGAETPIEDSAAPIKDPSGKLAGVVMVFRDVSEDRASRQLVLESEERYRTLVEVSPQTVWAGRADGSMTYFNRWWFDYTGLTMEQSEGKGWTRAISPDHRQRLLDVWLKAAAAGESYEIEIPFRRASDGTYRWHLARGMPVTDEGGRVVKWMGVAFDIDDRRAADEARRAAQEEAVQANRAKDQFLAVLSHELRTPLNPILLAVTSMLGHPSPPEDLRPMLEMIRNNVELQARLIDDLLDVMRIVRGKMPLHWEVADCHRLIDQAVQICRSEVLGKRLRLDVELAADLRHVNADAARLQQLFWNLIKNAVKFTPEGGTIAIRTRAEVGAANRIVIEVSDTGIGIEADVLPKIFEPFQQGESSITRKFGGLGLGLAICLGIVEAHGGTLSAESRGKGTGSTFRVALEALSDPASEAVGEPDRDATSVPSPLPSSLSILAVDDEPTTLKLLARLLRGLGHEVKTAGTIALALETVEGGNFDLIISDIGLPDGTGLELVRRIIEMRGPVPAIALTGYGMEEDIRRSRDAGFSAHLTKPIDFAKLEAMIRQVAPTRA